MKQRLLILTAFVLLLAAPLIGGLSGGLREDFFDYPPLVVQPPEHAPFSWPVFVVFAACLIGAAILAFVPRLFGFKPALTEQHATHRMPWWGLFGIALTVLAWIGAWARFEWLGFMRNHMFAPLWFGFVFTMDGLVFRRTGTSLIARSRKTFAWLFPASAASWWYFEYLNRFVQNWWYEGIDGFGSWHYIIFSSICFSTVLPGIFESYEFLTSFDLFRTGFSRGIKWRPLPRPVIVGVVALGVIGLALLGRFTDPLFFVTWLAPWAILEGCLALAGIDTPSKRLREGDYTELIGLAFAALLCGFFWEMWNFYSLPKWHYSVPYVNRFHIFEMPVVGYGGYFPFGPVCWCFWLAWKALTKPNTATEGVLSPQN